MTTQEAVVQSSRQWDYIYDPTYTMSGPRDHSRAEMKAYTSADRIRKNISYKTMFSCLKHFPSHQIRIQSTDPIPRFIERGFRQFPEANLGSKARINPQVSGMNRYKYFRRPNIPALSSTAYQDVQNQEMQTNLAQTNVVNVGGIGTTGPDTAVIAEAKTSDQLNQNVSGMRTIQTQTDYRESEAQTDPYSPDWVLSDTNANEAPEIVTLMSLTYGAGLPAGPIEIELIERARARRKWEASLPPLSDFSPQALEKRRKMMAEAEREQWVWRETNLERLHKARLELLAQALNDRNELKHEQTEERLETLKVSQENDARRTLEKYRMEHIKAIRKLIKSSNKRMANVPDPSKHGKVEGAKRDIIQDYSDCGSHSWAPLSRNGVFPDRNAEQNNIVNNENTNRSLNTLNGLIELEASLPRSVTDVMVTPPIPPSEYQNSGAGFVPRALRQQHELDQVYEMLCEEEKQKNKIKQKIDPNGLKLLKKVEKPQPRPDTPTREFDEELDMAEQSALTVQRIIRGKAIQKQWEEGAERRADLLAELRAVKGLEDHESKALLERKKAVELQQKTDVAQKQKDKVVESIIAEFVGNTISDKLDFVSKELIRLQEERRFHALSLLAERRRRMREAAESGLRQAEERRRREEDEIFKQVLKVHQDTVDQFLADVYGNASETVAKDQAHKKICDLADKVGKAADLADQAIRAAEEEGNITKAQQLTKEICAELVHDFLIPEAARMSQREEEDNKQKLAKFASEKVVEE